MSEDQDAEHALLLSSRLSELRKLRGLTAKTIALDTGLAESTVKKVLSGDTSYREPYHKIAKTLGVDRLLDLLGEKGQRIITAARRAAERGEIYAGSSSFLQEAAARASEVRAQREETRRQKSIIGGILSELCGIRDKAAIADIAQKCEVSPGTVSGVLGGSGEYSEDAYRKVAAKVAGRTLEDLLENGGQIIADARKTALAAAVVTHGLRQQALEKGQEIEVPEGEVPINTPERVTGLLLNRARVIIGKEKKELAQEAKMPFKTGDNILAGLPGYAPETISALGKAAGLSLRWDEEKKHHWVDSFTVPEGDKPKER